MGAVGAANMSRRIRHRAWLLTRNVRSWPDVDERDRHRKGQLIRMTLARGSMKAKGRIWLGAVVSLSGVLLCLTALKLRLSKVSPMVSQPVAHSDSIAASIPELELLITEVMEEWKVQGLAVAVVQNGEVAFVGGYGLRDVEASLKVTTDTQFQLMSVSKPFTATGLAILVDERRMDWKKPVPEYIPEFRLHDAIASDRVTVRDLLATIPGCRVTIGFGCPAICYPRQMLVAMRCLEPSDDIRSTFQYSNLGYLVASMVAERVSGQSWAKFTRALTDKLHMKVTFTVEELAAAAGAAEPYAMNGDTRLRSKLWPVSVTAAGGMSTSIASFANWLRFHLGKASLKGNGFCHRA
jgi:CubicO group peptidase (beta-lactamase class C family)